MDSSSASMNLKKEILALSALAKGVNPENMDLVLPDESPEFDKIIEMIFTSMIQKNCFVYFKSKKIC